MEERCAKRPQNKRKLIKGGWALGMGFLQKSRVSLNIERQDGKKNNIHSLLQFQSRKPALISKNSYVM